MITLEDLDGAIDVLLFPSAYQLASTYLVEDAILTVKGRLSRSKDQPELHGQEVSVPDLTEGPSGPVVISLPSTRCTAPVVEQLRDVLGTHPGMTEVQLRLLTRSATTVMRLDDRLRVTPEPRALRRPQAPAGTRMPERMSAAASAARRGQARSSSRAAFVRPRGGRWPGLVWEWLWTPPRGVVVHHRWVQDEVGLRGDFSGTGTYVVVAAVAGSARRRSASRCPARRHELVTLVAARRWARCWPAG